MLLFGMTFHSVFAAVEKMSSKQVLFTKRQPFPFTGILLN